MPLLSLAWIPVLLWSATPCFRGQPPLVATDLYEQLRPFAIHPWTADDAKSGSLGTCQIAEGMVRSEAGVAVAEVHCGMSIMVRGVVDPYGLQVGARGQDVIDAYGAAVAGLGCIPDGDRRTGCWFDETEDSWQAFGYIVEGTPPPSDDWGIRGAAAARFLAAHTVIELQQRGGCH